MSYTIIYDKQFVKVNDKFIPILYWGSNNCFDYSNNSNGVGRRSREWENWKFGLNSIAQTKEELLAMCETYKQTLIDRNNDYIKENPTWDDKYEDKHFGYFAGLAINTANTSKTTYGMFKGLFVTGMQKALTVEELREFGVSINIRTSSFNKEQLKTLELPELDEYVKSTDELITLIETLKSYPMEAYYVNIRADENKMKLIRRIYKQNNTKPTKERKTKTVTTGYSFMCDAMHFVKNTKYGFRYTLYPNSSSIKVVYNEKEALKKLDSLNALHTQKFTLRTFTLENPKTIFV